MSPKQEQIFDQERRHRAQRAARIGRLRRWLRPLPRRSNLQRYPIIRWFESLARRRPYLWSFGSRPVRRAIYVGAVIAFLPVYGIQIFLAFWAAVLLRANLAVTCALQLATNPLTAGPLYYATYRVGHFLIQTLELGEGRGALGTRINALVLGGIVVGFAAAVAVDVLYRIALWEADRLRARHQTVREAADHARTRAADAPTPVEEQGGDWPRRGPA